MLSVTSQTVIAERTSYSSIDGSVLSDGITRKDELTGDGSHGLFQTWLGEVVDPEPSANSIPRTVSMTWTDPCDTESFLLKLVSRNADGSTSIFTSVPCSAGSSNEICMVELEMFFHDESETEDTTKSSSSSSSSKDQGSRMLKERRVSTTYTEEGSLRSQGMSSDRRLQGTTVIDVLIVYSPEAAYARGIAEAQLLTRIVEGMVTLNQAITNSGIAGLEYRLVQVAELPYSQMAYIPSDDIDLKPELDALAANSNVTDLRNQYQGDLVQLVGYFPGTCGLGYIFNGDAAFGFSLVDSNCFDNFSHTHEIAHNMGCYHDKNNSDTQHAYRHGWRYCEGADPYRTIMSYYHNGCGGDPTSEDDPIVPRVNYFSNPNVTYLNKSTGTAAADNARCIEDSMVAVSEFRDDGDFVCSDDGDTCTVDSDCCVGFCGSAGICATEQCGGAGGDTATIEDMVCDPENNVDECQYDGGDCCECDCSNQVCDEDNTCVTPAWDCVVDEALPDNGAYTVPSGDCPSLSFDDFDNCDYTTQPCLCTCRESDPATALCGSGTGFDCLDPASDCVKEPTGCVDDGDCTLPEECTLVKLVCEVPILTDPTAGGDPHMTGFHGQKFDFTGNDGQWYCLISDLPSMHLNMRVTAPVSSRPDITYITGLSLITTDGGGQEHSIIISVKDPHNLDSDCPPGVSPCLADGSLIVVLDGNETLFAPGAVELAPDVKVSAVNIPGACRSFGFEKYWERKKLEYAQAGGRGLLTEQSMGEWILGDPTATNVEECTEYVARHVAGSVDGDLFAHQSEHTSFQIVTPTAVVRLSHGRRHQIAELGLPDHVTWQMNLAVDHNDVSLSAKGVLGETLIPTRAASGEYVMHGMEAIRGTEEDYHVDGPLGLGFNLS
ncbi:unnamed protein product [Ectocarpus sp. CCAP 1310/34]|nr:unnamed protein product [Ectocarpus sp. CCAP 1310/34]